MYIIRAVGKTADGVRTVIRRKVRVGKTTQSLLFINFNVRGFPRPEESGAAPLYWHLVPFDVVSKMYTGMLKPLIFDQNEQEYHSTLNF